MRLNGGDNHGGGTGVFFGGSDPAVTSPGGVTLGDVDSDGDLDLLLSSGSTNTVSVRLNGGDNHGSGTGVFSGGSDLTVSSPGTLALGDVDGDGDPDLLVTSGNTNTVSVRLNGGDNHGGGTGVFSGGSDPAVGTNPSSVAVGDVDGDGDLDLVVANYNNGNSGTVSVRLNQPAQIPPAITTPPASTLVCAGSAATFSVVATNATSYQWQVKSGSSFIDLGNTAPYSGVTTSTLTITGATAALSGTQYQVVVSGNCPSVTSSAATLTVNSVPTPTVAIKPASSVYTGGNAAALYLGYGSQSVTLTASGGATYQWSPATGLSASTGATTMFTATKPGSFTYFVTATSASGCQATTSVTLTVTDVRCGNKNDKVSVCHKGTTLCLDGNAVAEHLNHGDQFGTCTTGTANASNAVAAAEAPTLDLHTLLEIYPNPMAEQATLHFHTAEGGTAQVYVYDQLGRLVATLFNAEVQSGQEYHLPLKRDDYASGLYFCRLIANGQVTNVRLSIVK